MKQWYALYVSLYPYHAELFIVVLYLYADLLESIKLYSSFHRLILTIVLNQVME